MRAPLPRWLVALMRMPTPVWLAWPLMFLGLGFIVAYPFGRDWSIYGAGLFFAVLIGIRTRTKR